MEHYGMNNDIDKQMKHGNLGESYPLSNMGQGQAVEVKLKPDGEEEEVEGWGAAWYNFSQGTTLHGVNRITEPTPFRIRRLLWLLVVLLGVTLFTKQVIESVQHYLSWPVTVNVKINYNKTLTFPAVTVCNQNDFRTTATASAGLYKLVQHYYSHLRDGQTDLDSYNASDITLDFLYNQTAHRKADMIVRCEWDESLCGEEDFKEIFTDYGRCFSFNLASLGHTLRKVQRTGADRGLRLLLNIEQYEYMLGPNPGAGIKILIHENNEIPSVRDLGHAIPPGSHAYVGIQITEVKNLHPPQGKCNDTVQLKYFRDYSVPACVEECKTDFLEKQCGCRDFYMNSVDINGREAPPVCTLQQYQNCTVPKIAEEFYKPLPDGVERCDCPIACSRLLFDPTISYAATSVYDTENYKRNSNITNRLQERFLAAREVFQRVDEVELSRNNRLISALNTTTLEVEALLQDLTVNLKQLQSDLHTDVNQLKKRTHFHRRWGVEKVKYIVHNDFVRGWEVIDERTFSLVTVGYQELTAYLNHAANTMKNTRPEETSLRNTLYVSADKDLLAKETLCNRARDNITLVEAGFVNVSVILTYLASPGRRYDMTWVSGDVIRVEPRTEEYINKFKLRTNQFCERNAILRDLLWQLAEGEGQPANVSEIIDDVKSVGLRLEAAARSFNYYRFIIFDRVVMETGKAADKVIANFDLANQTMMEDFERLQLGLTDVLSFLGKLRTSWQLMTVLNERTKMYLEGRTNKTALAELIFSDGVTEAQNALKSYFNEARIRAHDVKAYLKRYKMSTQKLWRNMLQESTLKKFYEAVHSDVTEAERNSTFFEKLLGTFAYMTTGISKSDIQQNVTILNQYMNADFEITDPKEKVEEISQLFGEWSERVDIGGSIGDLDTEFFMYFDDLSDNLKAFIDGNQLNSLFFEDNFLSVDIFMKELSYEEIEQQVAYDMTSLWSDIGGSMGLFIGASVITGFEFLDVIVINLIRLHCSGRRKGKVP